MAIDDSLQAVENLLLSVTESSVPLLSQTSAHILGAGGKRLRPRLVLLAYDACGGQTPEIVVPLAAAVEIIHTATLVHDDINDHGTLRRGRETVNSRWGGTFALLTGDFLFAKTYEIMAGFSGEFNRILASATRELVEGETLQIHAARQGQLDKALYYEIIAKKTASLFVASTRLGAAAAQAPAAWADALASYAHHLGMAFQVTDDVLDLVADPEQLGKNAGIDLVQGRGFAAVGAAPVRSAAAGSVSSGASRIAPDTAPAPFKASMVQGRALKAAIKKGRDKARELADAAARALEALPPSPSRDSLCDLTRLVIERDH